MRVHLREDVTIDHFSEEVISLRFPHGVVEWSKPSVTLKKRIERLLKSGSEDLYVEDSDNLASLFYFLETLKRSSLLSYTVMENATPIITITPHYHGTFELSEKKIVEEEIFQISRFAFLRRVNNFYRIESPLIQASVVLKTTLALEFFFALSSPQNLKSLKLKFATYPEELITDLLTLFYRANLLSDTDQDPSLACWEFHDLLFHTKSRQRSENPHGATFRFLNFIPPKPPFKKPPEKVIYLFKPDINQLMKSGPTFTQVLETRKSIRKHSTIPISKEQIGEFLYRSARIKGLQKAKNYDATHRPYPGGGACYELELYLLIQECTGLEPGLYHYHPDIHAINSLPSENVERENLMKLAAVSAAKEELPQILILIAARFERVTWKYESMAYSLILKDTGALMQTMYLVATAMNLAPCALGSGNSDLFSKIAKTNYYEETTVGEFMLGSSENS